MSIELRSLNTWLLKRKLSGVPVDRLIRFRPTIDWHSYQLDLILILIWSNMSNCNNTGWPRIKHEVKSENFNIFVFDWYYQFKFSGEDRPKIRKNFHQFYAHRTKLETWHFCLILLVRIYLIIGFLSSDCEHG